MKRKEPAKMPWVKIAAALIGIVLLFVVVKYAVGGVLDNPRIETRYCGAPLRDASGVIIRSDSVRAAFQRIHPCPSTKLPAGACPGWQKDHVISMGAKHPTLGGGCDSVANMQWLPVEIKTCKTWYCKDRWELWVYSLMGK